MGGMNDWQGKQKYLEKTCPSAALFTANPTRLDPGANPGRSGEKPKTPPELRPRQAGQCIDNFIVTYII
jgi:hypothetical protein